MGQWMAEYCGHCDLYQPMEKFSKGGDVHYRHFRIVGTK